MVITEDDVVDLRTGEIFEIYSDQFVYLRDIKIAQEGTLEKARETSVE